MWEFLAVGLLVLDFVAFGAGFNPAVDPALLDYTPPVIEFLQQDASLWRYATFTPPGTTKTMKANVGMAYDLQTVAGYNAIFSRQYTDYVALIEEQDGLPYSQIASFSEWSSLVSPLSDLLNVKYVITEVEIPNPAKYRLVYQDEAVLVYENLGVMPRAFALPTSATVETASGKWAKRRTTSAGLSQCRSTSGSPNAGRADGGKSSRRQLWSMAANSFSLALSCRARQ